MINEGSPLLIEYTRANTNYIELTNAADEAIYNCFAYGAKSFIVNEGSTNLLAANVGADNLGSTMIITKGGSAVIMNMMRWNGSSYLNSGTKLKIFNRLTISNITEEPVIYL